MSAVEENVASSSKSTSAQKRKQGPEPSSSEEKKKGKKVVEKCIAECNPGKNNSCYKRSRRKKENQLSCVEVKQLLQGMGIESLKDINRCTLSAIQKGFIQLEGKPEELDMVVFEEKGNCGHIYKPTLTQLLHQTDNNGNDCGGSATIWCPEYVEGKDDYECWGMYATNLCNGRPGLDYGKGHHHCGGCPGFGRCLNDCRSSCYNKHGVHTNKVYFVGGCYDNWTDSEDEEDKDCSIM